MTYTFVPQFSGLRFLPNHGVVAGGWPVGLAAGRALDGGVGDSNLGSDFRFTEITGSVI